MNNANRKLSWREYQILFFLRQGLRNREIASKLSINEKTVSTYLARLKRKIGAREQDNAYATVRVGEEGNWFNIDNVDVRDSQIEQFNEFKEQYSINA